MTSQRRAGELGLAGLQRWLFEHVTSATPRRLGRAARHVSAGGLPVAARLEVYRHAYFARLAECLADDYPAVARALGPTAFGGLCRAYVAAHPPRSASLNAFGAGFSEFCRQKSPELAFAADLARLEWAVVEAIHADATRLLDPTPLTTLDEQQWAPLRLEPSPALRLVRSAYPVYDYYRDSCSGGSPAVPAPAPSALAVCRQGDDVWRLRLAEPLAQLLERLVAGERLAAALDGVSAGPGSELSPGALQRAFGEWVACGCFAALRVE
jgi:hypothetical protein